MDPSLLPPQTRDSVSYLAQRTETPCLTHAHTHTLGRSIPRAALCLRQSYRCSCLSALNPALDTQAPSPPALPVTHICALSPSRSPSPLPLSSPFAQDTTLSFRSRESKMPPLPSAKKSPASSPHGPSQKWVDMPCSHNPGNIIPNAAAPEGVC